MPETAPVSRTGRYFLHVYDADPRFYLPSRGKPWFRALTTAGRQDLEVANLQDESQTLRNLLGDLEGYSLSAKVTNLVLEPIDTQHRPIYYCILSRIDSFTCAVGADQISLSSQRDFLSAPDGAIDRVAAFVASRLHLKAGSSEEKEPVEPDAPEGADAAPVPLDLPN